MGKAARPPRAFRTGREETGNGQGGGKGWARLTPDPGHTGCLATPAVSPHFRGRKEKQPGEARGPRAKRQAGRSPRRGRGPQEAQAAEKGMLEREEGGGKRGQALLTRPLHTEETRGGRSGGAGIAGTDPTAPSYRLTKWRRRPNTSPARSAHWLPPQIGGGASAVVPASTSQWVGGRSRGWSQEEWQATVGEGGCPSELKAETAHGIERGEKRWEHVTTPEPVIKLPSCVWFCGGSHLERGYVASQPAGSVLPPGCRHLANGQGSSTLGVRANIGASPFWSRAGHLRGSILLVGMWQKILLFWHEGRWWSLNVSWTRQSSVSTASHRACGHIVVRDRPHCSLSQSIEGDHCPLSGCRDVKTEAHGAQSMPPDLHTGKQTQDAESRILPPWEIQDRVRLHPSKWKNTLKCIPKSVHSKKRRTGLRVTGVPLR